MPISVDRPLDGADLHGRHLRAARHAGHAPRVRRDRVRRAAARRPHAGRRRLQELRRPAAPARRRSLPRAPAGGDRRARAELLRDAEGRRAARRDEAAAGQADRPRLAGHRRGRHPRGRGASLHRLARAAAAPRELPGAAGRTARGAEPAAATAGPGALADALPDAPPGCDRRVGRCPCAAGALRARRLPARPERAPQCLEARRPGRRGVAARHAAPRPPCGGVPHAGARRRGSAQRRAGGRRSVRAGRRHARLRHPLGLAAPAAAPPRRPAFRGGRLRQAWRQGARLRLRPRRGVPVRRRRRG
ncbi:hypothetical protein X551_04262 [Methylibium sp. T29]|nr:hypothetical protein X551_04262 [Methylibium sp. T29]